MNGAKKDVMEKMTKTEMKKFAWEGDHVLLYAAIERYYRGVDLTWEQCMEFAAINQAEMIKRLEKIIHNLYQYSTKERVLEIDREEYAIEKARQKGDHL